jgi:hypothetical protein
MTTKRDSWADLSTVARSAKVDRLDAAIDQVTARMVHVRDDEDLALRIASALPERSSRFHLRAARFGGQVSWLIPQFAAIAAFAIGVVLWTTRDTAPPSLLPSSDVVAVMAVPNTVVASAPGTVFRIQPLEPLVHLEPVEPLDRPDFDRSLAPIAPMTALVVTDVAPGELAPTPELLLAPLVIADLPLTAESFSPQ